VSRGQFLAARCRLGVRGVGSGRFERRGELRGWSRVRSWRGASGRFIPGASSVTRGMRTERRGHCAVESGVRVRLLGSVRSDKQGAWASGVGVGGWCREESEELLAARGRVGERALQRELGRRGAGWQSSSDGCVRVQQREIKGTPRARQRERKGGWTGRIRGRAANIFF
jgi:hypothetical protein